MFEQFLSLLAQFRSAWRFRWKGVIAMWVIAALGWFVVFLVPNRYESSARIFVDTNSMLRPLLEGIAVTANSGSRVDMVRRALLSRTQLESVIDTTDLRLRVSNPRQREDMLRDLALDITITADASSPQAREANIFTIAYWDRDKDLAYTVVKGLLDTFVRQSVGANRNDADAAQEFLSKQIADYERRLTESETRLAEFKKQNVGAMPDERGGYFGRLQAETAALDQVQAGLTVARHRRDDLRNRLLGGQAAGGSAGIVETSVDARIREETARLEEMLLRFTDQHPDVIAVRETLGRLEQQRQQELVALRTNEGALGRPRASTNLVAQNLQIALNESETQLASLQAQARDREQRLSELRAQINTLPGVEAELARLTRDYDVTRTEYERLLQRLEAAKLSDAADRMDEVRFKLIDAPVKAVLPIAPKRSLFLAAVVLLAIAGGAGLAWLLSQMQPVFVQSKDLEKFQNVPVLGVVSLVSAAGEHRWRGLASITVAVAGIAVCGGVLIAIHPYVEAVRDALVARIGQS